MTLMSGGFGAQLARKRHSMSGGLQGSLDLDYKGRTRGRWEAPLGAKEPAVAAE